MLLEDFLVIRIHVVEHLYDKQTHNQIIYVCMSMRGRPNIPA